jgi:uncharacterized protein YktA (UPF0223 family)
MKNIIKMSLSLFMIMVLFIGNFNLSYADSKNDLDTNLNKLTKIVETIEKTSTKKVAKKQLKESNKIYKKLKKLTISEKVKNIALDSAYSVQELCKEVKKENKLTPTLKLKADNCKVKIESTKVINKGLKGKKLSEVIRIEAARQLNYQSNNFNDKVLGVFTSKKEYDTDKLNATLSEIENQTSDIENYFSGSKTNYDYEIINAISDAKIAMLKFKAGKYTVAQYINKRTEFLDKINKYAPFDNFKSIS